MFHHRSLDSRYHRCFLICLIGVVAVVSLAPPARAAGFKNVTQQAGVDYVQWHGSESLDIGEAAFMTGGLLLGTTMATVGLIC